MNISLQAVRFGVGKFGYWTFYNQKDEYFYFTRVPSLVKRINKLATHNKKIKRKINVVLSLKKIEGAEVMTRISTDGEFSQYAHNGVGTPQEMCHEGIKSALNINRVPKNFYMKVLED